MDLIPSLLKPIPIVIIIMIRSKWNLKVNKNILRNDWYICVWIYFNTKYLVKYKYIRLKYKDENMVKWTTCDPCNIKKKWDLSRLNIGFIYSKVNS